MTVPFSSPGASLSLCLMGDKVLVLVMKIRRLDGSLFSLSFTLFLSSLSYHLKTMTINKVVFMIFRRMENKSSQGVGCVCTSEKLGRKFQTFLVVGYRNPNSTERFFQTRTSKPDSSHNGTAVEDKGGIYKPWGTSGGSRWWLKLLETWIVPGLWLWPDLTPLAVAGIWRVNWRMGAVSLWPSNK